MTDQPTADRRVCFDFEIGFSNGGGIQGQGFRLDIDGDDITDAELGRSIVRDLRLLMVGSVRILNKTVIHERHKRSARPLAPQADGDGRLVDLSHAVAGGEIHHPGLPAPVVTEHLGHAGSAGRYAPGVSFQIGRVDMVANTGTSVDAPYHRYPGTPDVADLPLDALADLDGVVIRLDGMAGRAIGAAALAATAVEGRAVLLDTGWARRWGSPAYQVDRPFLTGDGARFLADRGARLVGIDALNIDDTDDPERPAHSILLAAGIPIVENLAHLDGLPIDGFRFSAAPMRLRGMGAFPVRAWARLVTPPDSAG